jgi:hypothetical protein
MRSNMVSCEVQDWTDWEGEKTWAWEKNRNNVKEENTQELESTGGVTLR